MAEEKFAKEALAHKEKVLQKREAEAAAKDEDDRSRREPRAKVVKLATAISSPNVEKDLLDLFDEDSFGPKWKWMTDPLFQAVRI